MPSAFELRARYEPALMGVLANLPEGVLRALLPEPVVIDGQQLDIETQLFLKRLTLIGGPALETLSVAEARVLALEGTRIMEGRKPEMRVEPVTVTGAAGPLDARLYIPDGAGDGGGLLVYYHGGGFAICDLDTHDHACRFLASHADTRVLSVQYRLAPEHRFPAAIDDALAAFRFAGQHASELGADRGRIAVAGDSAGGNLAAGVARLAAREAGPDGGSAPIFQLLIYPWVDLSTKRASHRLFADGFYLTDAELDWYIGLYVNDATEVLDPRCSPLLADDLRGLAPAYVLTAGFDPLRDEGEEYAARLGAAGVPVALRRHPGLIHGFFDMLAMGRVAREALAEAAGALCLGLAEKS